MKKDIHIHYEEFDSQNSLSEDYKLLVNKAKDASKSSYSPYSKFKVGAAVLLDNGKIVTGNNQENAAYPSGLCAERVAMFYANAKYPNNSILAIAIVATNTNGFLATPITPCGSCRQVLRETEQRYNQEITTILYGKKKIYIIPSIKSLLPFSFDKNSLH